MTEHMELPWESTEHFLLVLVCGTATDVWEDMPSNSHMNKFRLTFKWAGGAMPDITRVVQHLRTDTNNFSFVLKACKKPDGMCFRGMGMASVSVGGSMLGPTAVSHLDEY